MTGRKATRGVFWKTLFILACLAPAHKDANAAVQDQCARSIRWQYPVRFELLLKALPQPDLYGATPQAQDLSDLQVRVYDYQRKLIRSREVGPDAVLRDGKWTAVKELFLEWGRYTIEVEGPTILSFQQNITLPRDAFDATRDARKLGMATRDARQLAVAKRRNLASVTEQLIFTPEINHFRGKNFGIHAVPRSTSHAQVFSAAFGHGVGVVDGSWQGSIEVEEATSSSNFQQVHIAGGQGRRLSGVCGGQGQMDCVCNADFCCMGPEAIRSPNSLYKTELQTRTGSTVKVNCKYAICNVTLDEVVAPGCNEGLGFSCLSEICTGGSDRCSVFTPGKCTTCKSCLGAGLASWCFNLTTQSGECQRAQPQSGGNGRCQMSRSDPGYFCSACDDQCGKPIETVKVTPAPQNDLGSQREREKTCNLLQVSMPQNHTACDKLVQNMWCDHDCWIIFEVLRSLHASPSSQPLLQSDNLVLCSSTCYFTKYRDYLERVDSGTCVLNLNASLYRPPDPYIFDGFLPGNVPSKGSDLTRFAEANCIYNKASTQITTQEYCLGILTEAGTSSKIEDCRNIPVDTNFSTWKCPDNCALALARFFESVGCCVYSLEYPRYAIAGYPFYIKDLVKACKIEVDSSGIDQPCAGVLTSDCGDKSVCLGVSAAGRQLSNGMYVGENETRLCLCTDGNDRVRNLSGSLTCTDQDECLLKVSTCHNNATCINTLGSYYCQCNDGFEGNGNTCIPKSCARFQGVDTCVLCGEKCCARNEIPVPSYTQVVDIGCSNRPDSFTRDLTRRMVSSPSRFDIGTCLENVKASIADCAGNKSVMGMPCALWAKHNYFCANLSYPLRSNTPPIQGWGHSQFWCVRNASGGVCDNNKVSTVFPELDGVGLKAQAMCQADGTYNTTIQCERITCGFYTAPENGLVDGDWDEAAAEVTPRPVYYPEIMTVICKDGYRPAYDGSYLDPSSPLLSPTCYADKSFSVSFPRLACLPRFCGNYSDFLTSIAKNGIYGESATPDNICDSVKATNCQKDCCSCLSRIRDCLLSPSGCPDCNQCEDCKYLATTCSGLCSLAERPSAISPVQFRDMSIAFKQKVDLSCREGYELARVFKGTGNTFIGSSQPECAWDNFTSAAKFQVGMSCLVKACPKLDVDYGAVMPDLEECRSQFDECVERRRKEEQAGQPRDIDMSCITELEAVKGCSADTEVLYSERVRIVCKLGYGPRSSLTSTLSNTASCLSDGNFSNYTPCERKSCGVFSRPHPTNSSSESEGQEVLYQDTVKVTCNVGYSPKEQLKVCQASGELELPGFEPCKPYVCEEFGVQNGLTYCSTRKCTPRCEHTEYEPCERPIVNKTWHSFNNPNEFKIVCNPGFFAFPSHVLPIVQCSINGTYNTCPECRDSNESLPDFSGPVIDFECRDSNECLPGFSGLAPDACDRDSTECKNTVGSYTCICLHGFKPFEENQVMCQDIDECNEVPQACENNAKCSNTIGSFWCSCNTGYGPAGTGGDGKIMGCDRLKLRLFQEGVDSDKPSMSGLGIFPIIYIEGANGVLSHTPWDQNYQWVTASLVQLIDDNFADMNHLLIGNKTVDAPKGIAKFTDLDIHLPGAGYKINFKLLRDFKVDIPCSTAVFSVQAGPIAMLRLIVQPSLMATTGEVLKTQPVLDLTDMHGNLNPGAIPTLVSVSMTPVDAKAFRGYMGGTIYGGVAKSSLGVIKFTDLALFGIGAWNINFTCEINFIPVIVRAQNATVLNQVNVESVEIKIDMNITDWNDDNEKALIAASATICKLDPAAFEIKGVREGSVIVRMAMNVKDPAPFWERMKDDLTSGKQSLLQSLGVYGFKAPGINIEFPKPSTSQGIKPMEKPYTGIPVDVVNYMTGITEAIVIAGTIVGIALAIFSELAAASSNSARFSELVNPEAEPEEGSRWHTGYAHFSGGAFKTFIYQVQCIAALCWLGGRGSQPEFYFAFPEPTVNTSFRTIGFHNQSLIAEVRLPYAMRTLADRLEWTNIRANVTTVLGRDNLFPHPCDAFAQQVTIGTFLLFLFMQCCGSGVRVIVHKAFQRYTLITYGQASTSAAITFPKWEGLVITKTYYGITQVVGVCIGSLCRDYMIIGICLGAFPLGVLILMTFCTYQAVTCQQGGHKIVKVESIPTKAEEDMQTRHKWKWKRQISLNDSRCTPWMRFLLMFAATFNDLRDGPATYYNLFTMLLRMCCGIASGAAHDWKISSSIFLAFYAIELLVLAMNYPFLDIVRNRMEVFLSLTRVSLVALGFQYFYFLENQNLTPVLGIDYSELIMFGITIGSIAVAFLYQMVEVGLHIRSVVKKSGNHSAEESKAGKAVLNDGRVVVPQSISAFRGVNLHDDKGEQLEVLDRRYLVLKVTIQDATGLKSVDCRRYRSICLVKIGKDDLDFHHRNFGDNPVIYHDGESVFGTCSAGFTESAHSARWDETFSLQIADEEAVLTFFVWEQVGNLSKHLGTAIVHLEPLLNELNTMPQPLQKECYLKGQGDDSHVESKSPMGILKLSFECNFPRLWPLVDTVQTNHYRLSTLSTTYIGLEKKADAQFTKLKSQNIRRDLVGSHMPQPVSRTLAADHLKEMADATWRFRQDTDLTCPSIWDQANPEGEENGNKLAEARSSGGLVSGMVVASDVMLRERPGSRIGLDTVDDRPKSSTALQMTNPSPIALESNRARRGAARPSAAALRGRAIDNGDEQLVTIVAL